MSLVGRAARNHPQQRPLGCELVDMLHLASYRPQPPGRTQQHARRNYSTMLVFVRTACRDGLPLLGGVA